MENTGFVPCSAKHKGCTKAHSELVWGFRAERRRQELELEAITKGHKADEVDHFARGGKKLITFKQWLIAHKRVKTVAEEVAEAIPARIAPVATVVFADEARLVSLSDADFWSAVAA